LCADIALAYAAHTKTICLGLPFYLYMQGLGAEIAVQAAEILELDKTQLQQR
jgi:hypothetical protein